MNKNASPTPGSATPGLRLLFRGWLLCIVALLWQPTHAQQDDPIGAQLARMSLEQKAAQMAVVSFFGTELPYDVQEFLAQWQPGAVVLLPRNLDTPEQMTRLTNAIQQQLIDSGGLPAFITVDQEGGIISRLQEGFTRWPVPSLLTATQNPQLAYRFGEALAEELRAVGFNMNLAPVADLHTNPVNPVIGRRAFGSFPQQVAPMVAAVVQGMQANGVLATLKHFPGHGDTFTDSHIELPTLPYSPAQLANRELIPFVASIEAGAGAVMVAHLSMPVIEPDVRLPSSLSENVVTNLLREGMEYEGLIVTDALDMDAVDRQYSTPEATVRAVQAGHDLIILGAHISPQAQAAAMQALVDAVHSGEIAEARLDESVRRILRAKAAYGVLGWQPLDPDTARERIARDEHEALIPELFAQGITLVMDGPGLVPLPDSSLFVYPATRPSLWQACQPSPWQPMGVSLYPTQAEMDAVAQAARNVEGVVVFTQNVADNTAQQNLVALLDPGQTLVVALWSPYDLQSLPTIGSYLVSYSPLLQANEALCAILHGEQPARGVLSLNLD